MRYLACAVLFLATIGAGEVLALVLIGVRWCVRRLRSRHTTRRNLLARSRIVTEEDAARLRAEVLSYDFTWPPKTRGRS